MSARRIEKIVTSLLAVGGATIIVTVASPARAETRVISGAMCWKDGKSLVDTFDPVSPSGAAPPSVVEVVVVSVVQLFPEPWGERPGEPARSVRITTHPGKAELEHCTLWWEAPMVPSQEGSERQVTPISPTNGPYRRPILKRVGVAGATLENLSELDLDGDGTKEVIFTGSYRSAPSEIFIDWHRRNQRPVPRWAKTSFAGVLIAPSGSTAQVRYLARGEDMPALGVPGVWIGGVTDLQGDGRLELVLESRGDHWASSRFVEFQNSFPLREVLTATSW